MAQPTRTGNTTPQIAVEIRDPGGKVSRVPLTQKRMVIGRSSSCDIQLKSQEVSRQHAELKKDPFGVWWLNDLESTTGTDVNGIAQNESAIKLGDHIQIGPFVMRVIEMAPVPIEDLSGTQIRSLSALGDNHIETSHLATIKEFGERLMQTRDVHERLKLLCRLLVRRDFHGKAAVALRLRGKSNLDPDAIALCETQLPPRGGKEPTMSKGLLRAVCHSGLPVMAQGESKPADPGALKLTIVGEDSTVAMACPIAEREDSMDIVYAVFPAEYGDTGWLALVTLAAQQYQQTEAAFRAAHRHEAEAAIAQEIEEAQKIQKRFVSKWGMIDGLNVAVEFKQSHWVSGDCVDVQQMEDGRTLLMLANVEGGGLTASVNVAIFCSMFRALIGAGHGLVESLNIVDHELGRIPPGNVTAALAAIAIHPETGEIESAVAGMVPPYIIEPEGMAKPINPRQGQALGGRTEPIESVRTVLPEEHWLCMFTSGIPDLRDHEGRELGIGGWITQVATHVNARVSSAEVAAAKLNGWIVRLLGDREATDDLTFALIRRA